VGATLHLASGYFLEFSDKEFAMKRILFGLGAVALAALTTGCGAYYERSYAVAAPGTTYYGDNYYNGYYYRSYPSTAYAYPSTAYA
jgi:hypothetical protein